ncbi:MAG TPA: hypothetical protein VMQ93_07130 [Novosphingobium sp.]|nr:hypothetical protein [Novosphingobium sp.]
MGDEPGQEDAGGHLGVLVGWRSQDMGENMLLELQTVERATWEQGENPVRTRIMMTNGQAAVLANYLLRMSGATPPPRRRGWFASLFE